VVRGREAPDAASSPDEHPATAASSAASPANEETTAIRERAGRRITGRTLATVTGAGRDREGPRYRGAVMTEPDEPPTADTPARPAASSMGRVDKLPVRMLNDRILVKVDPEGDRRSTGGILIPATAQMGKRLAWAEVRAVGPNVRAVEVDDHVLFNPEEVYEVEVRGETFIILRERDIHALASERLEEGHTGLYL
jgi:chaperonin GroES